MKDKLSVSVIVPLHNCENTIDETLNSVLCQDFQDLELIIVENGSTDTSYSKALRYQDNPNVLICRSSVKGASQARNLGLSTAHGEYILFLDGDDILGESYISSHINFLINEEKKNEVVSIGCFDHYINGEIVPNNSLYKNLINDRGVILRKLFSNKDDFMLQTSCFLVHKSFFQTYAWKNYLSLDDDGDFIFSVLTSFPRIKFLTEAKFFYRKDINIYSLSRSRSRKALFSSFMAQENKFFYLRGDYNITEEDLISIKLKIALDFFYQNRKIGWLGVRLLVRKYGLSRIRKLLSKKSVLLRIFPVHYISIFYTLLFNYKLRNFLR